MLNPTAYSPILLTLLSVTAATAAEQSVRARSITEPTSVLAASSPVTNALQLETTNRTYALAALAQPYVLNTRPPDNQSELTDVVRTLSSPNIANLILTETRSLNATYDIWTQTCVPPDSNRSQTMLVLTHGIGFDHSYWTNLAIFLCLRGYVTVIYDRLGVGQSSKPDGINEVQQPTHIGVLSSLIKETNGAVNATNVVLIGHSFGSLISLGLVAEDPNSAQGLILTGFSLNTDGQKPFLAGSGLQIASQNNPARFINLSNSYAVTEGESQDQLLFLKYPYYDPADLRNLQLTKGTVTLGELMTQKPSPAGSYERPVFVINGQFDLPFCAGDCEALDKDKYIIAATPASQNVTVKYVQDAAHGIELQNSNITNPVHEAIFEWLKAWEY